MVLVALAATCLGTVPSANVLAAGGVSTPPAPGTYDVGGTVYAKNLSAGYIMVETQKGCFQPVYPDTSTSITKNGTPATLADVVVGSRVRTSNSLATRHALSIDAR